MNILVVGAAGYVGSHVCKALGRAGFNPIAFDNLSRGNKDAVGPNYDWLGGFIQGDILDYGAVLDALRITCPLAVIHLAGKAYVAESFENPAAYYMTNVVGTLNLLRAMAFEDISNLVFSSSCAVYGNPPTLPITEGDAHPISPYGHSKAMAERIIRDFEVAHDMTAIRLRYFNAAGSDPEGEIGERHDPETHLIPLAIAAARGGEPLVVNGNTHPTKDGTCIRDYVHVTDLADAHVLAVQHILDGQGGGAFNLGAGKGHSVIEVLDEVEKLSGAKVPGSIGPARIGDPPELWCTADRAREILGWEPKYTLADMVKHAWDFNG